MTIQEVNNVVIEAISYLAENSHKLIDGIDVNELTQYSVALAKHESGFNENAKNPNPKSSARGLFQILNGTETAIKNNILKYDLEGDIYDPLYSSILGVAYLAYQYKRYKNWRAAIIAYNLGSYKGQADTAYYKAYIKDFQEVNNIDLTLYTDYASDGNVKKRKFF